MRQYSDDEKNGHCDFDKLYIFSSLNTKKSDIWNCLYVHTPHLHQNSRTNFIPIQHLSIIHSIKQFIHHRSVLSEYEHSSLKNRVSSDGLPPSPKSDIFKNGFD
jgi:hypothetical protein